MKIFAQVLSATTGERTTALGASREDMAAVLKRLIDEGQTEITLDDYVLVLVDDCGRLDEKVQFSQAPLMLVSTFITNWFVEGPSNV